MELSLESGAPRLSTLPAFTAETVFVRSPPRAHAEAIARLRAVVRACIRTRAIDRRDPWVLYAAVFGFHGYSRFSTVRRASCFRVAVPQVAVGYLLVSESGKP